MKLKYCISYTFYKPILDSKMITAKNASRTQFERDLKAILSKEPDDLAITISCEKKGEKNG